MQIVQQPVKTKRSLLSPHKNIDFLYRLCNRCGANSYNYLQGGHTMKHIANTIFIAALAGLSTSVFSFQISRDSNLSQPMHIAAAETKTGSKLASPSATQGNEVEDERIEFEEQAGREEFGDKTDREEFKEQAIRREFGGQTRFIEPVTPESGNHDH